MCGWDEISRKIYTISEKNIKGDKYIFVFNEQPYFRLCVGKELFDKYKIDDEVYYVEYEMLMTDEAIKLLPNSIDNKLTKCNIISTSDIK